MLPHTGSTFLDINPISTTLQNQTKPNQTKRPTKKKEKKSQKKKKERMSSYEEKICSLSISLALSVSRTGSKEERSSVCVSSLPRPTRKPKQRRQRASGRAS
jgi:hypothetical protein